VAGRAVFAFAALTLFVVATSRGRPLEAFRGMGRAGLAVAGCTALASGTFIVALNHATVANVLFMQALSPILAALLAWIALGESVTRRSLLAMAVAVLGVAFMVGGPDTGGALGLGASFAMTLAFAVAIVITRHRRDISMAPAICLSQVIVVALAAPFASPSKIDAHNLVFLVLLGVGQMGVGLAFLTMGARLLPASEVALITLLEVVLGPLLVWLTVDETPSALTLLGGAVVVLAVVIQTTERSASQPFVGLSPGVSGADPSS
jgi:drug/metabolite transporter (DMT)-like permease